MPRRMDIDPARWSPRSGTVARLTGVVALVVLAALAGACAKPQAAAIREPEPLEVPVVPPRVLAEPIEPVREVAEEPAPEPEASEEDARARAPQPSPAETEEARAATPDEVPAAAPETAPEPLLRTPQTRDDGAAARRVQDMLGRAERDLGRVNSDALGEEAKSQFDTARRFLEQAGDALSARNYVFATYLASKAETLAREIVGRQ